jgi:2-dehydropantoate 2-reductase
MKENGLVIRHYAQFKTAVDKVGVIDALLPGDVYELIFVVMQYTQLPAVLPVLSANESRNIVFVGNNADPAAIKKELEQNSTVKKQVAFGFQPTGGRRENGRVICVRAGGRMVLGDLEGGLAWRSLMDKAFENTKYRLRLHPLGGSPSVTTPCPPQKRCWP